MLGFRSQFQGPLLTAALVALVTLVAAASVVAQKRGDRRRRLEQAWRVLAVGTGTVVVLTTAAPSQWPPTLASDGDLVLEPGDGGLGDWQVLLEQPDSLAAVLLAANVLLYIPLGFFARLGWHRSLPVIAAAAALSAAVETLQWQVLGRVGSTDDFLLNLAGAIVGTLFAVTAVRTTRGPKGLAGDRETLRRVRRPTVP